MAAVERDHGVTKEKPAARERDPQIQVGVLADLDVLGPRADAVEQAPSVDRRDSADRIHVQEAQQRIVRNAKRPPPELVAPPPARVDHLRARMDDVDVDARDERRELVGHHGRQPQVVGVEPRDDIARRDGERGVQRRADASMRRRDHPQPLVADGAQDVAGVVRGPVIDDDELERTVRLAEHARDGFRHERRAVPRRHEHRHEGSGALIHARTLPRRPHRGCVRSSSTPSPPCFAVTSFS